MKTTPQMEAEIKNLRVATARLENIDRSHNYSGKNTQAAQERPVQLLFDRLSDVELEDISWVWPGRIARRKVSLLAGDPGIGKSQIAIDIASRITRQGTWPDDGSAPLGSVIVLAAEDSTGDTVRPRFEAAGADLDRVHVLRAVMEQGRRRTFSLQKDLAALLAKITALGDVS